jgi:hypothetical protein
LVPPPSFRVLALLSTLKIPSPRLSLCLFFSSSFFFFSLLSLPPSLPSLPPSLPYPSSLPPSQSKKQSLIHNAEQGARKRLRARPWKAGWRLEEEEEDEEEEEEEEKGLCVFNDILIFKARREGERE